MTGDGRLYCVSVDCIREKKHERSKKNVLNGRQAQFTQARVLQQLSLLLVTLHQ